MSWKPIPHEAPAVNPSKKTHIRHRFQKHALKLRKNKHANTSYRLIQSVGIRLLDYVKNDGKQNLQEVRDLVTDMQRTIVNLQKKRSLLLEKEKRKNTRKKKFRPKFKIKKIQK